MLAHCRLMARYNAWMNQRLYAIAARMTDEERRRNRGAFFKSVHGTLNHILVGDGIWMARFEGLPHEWHGFDHEAQADFAGLGAARVAMDARIAAYVERLTPELLASDLDYRSTAGQARHIALATALSHFFNHQTHHRGQATTVFAQLGIDVGATDIVAMPADWQP